MMISKGKLNFRFPKFSQIQLRFGCETRGVHKGGGFIWIVVIPDLQVGFSFRHTGSQIPYHGRDAENEIARTKNAVNLLDWARWKNTQLLGTSNLISFLLAPTDGVPSRWSKKIGDYDKEDDHCSNDYLGFTGTLVVFGLDEKSIWRSGSTQGSN